MADVKCGRCDRHYSKFRSRCPYCGAARNKKGKRAVDRDNATWKVVVGSVILVVLIAAVAAILIVTMAGDKAPDVGTTNKDNQQVSTNVGESGNSDSGGVSSVQGQDPDNDDGNQDNVDDLPAAPTLNSIRITTRGGEDRTDVTMKVHETATLSYRTDPDDYEGTVTWTSSDESILVVLQSGELTAVSKGTVTLTVTLEGKTAECIVRVIEG